MTNCVLSIYTCSYVLCCFLKTFLYVNFFFIILFSLLLSVTVLDGWYLHKPIVASNLLSTMFSFHFLSCNVQLN